MVIFNLQLYVKITIRKHCRIILHIYLCIIHRNILHLLCHYQSLLILTTKKRLESLQFGFLSRKAEILFLTK